MMRMAAAHAECDGFSIEPYRSEGDDHEALGHSDLAATDGRESHRTREISKDGQEVMIVYRASEGPYTLTVKAGTHDVTWSVGADEYGKITSLERAAPNSATARREAVAEARCRMLDALADLVSLESSRHEESTAPE